MKTDPERESELYEEELRTRINKKIEAMRAEIIGGRNDKFMDTCEEFLDFLLDNPKWPKLVMANFACNHAVVGVKFEELFGDFLFNKAEIEAIRELDTPVVPRKVTAQDAIKAVQKALQKHNG